MIAVQRDLSVIAQQAERLRDDYEAFGYYIDLLRERENRTDAELDRLVNEIAAEVIPQIDCTACANCCRSLTVGLTPDDVLPLVEALHLPPERVIAIYVDRDAGAQHDEWGVFHCSPCALLHDRRCTIYAHRPQSCRDYPALTPDFRWLYGVIARGAGLCPIIFNVIERLKLRLDW